MIKRTSRLALPAILAAFLLSGLPAAVLASAPWLSNCSGGAGSNYLCIYSDRDFAGNRAHMSGSNNSYAGETYPSSSNNVNDSVSSLKNLYSSKDVTWFNEPISGGAEFCVDFNTAVSWVGLFSNDAFSRHVVATDDIPC